MSLVKSSTQYSLLRLMLATIGGATVVYMNASAHSASTRYAPCFYDEKVEREKYPYGVSKPFLTPENVTYIRTIEYGWPWPAICVESEVRGTESEWIRTDSPDRWAFICGWNFQGKNWPGGAYCTFVANMIALVIVILTSLFGDKVFLLIWGKLKQVKIG